jgi:hypothetical protein
MQSYHLDKSVSTVLFVCAVVIRYLFFCLNIFYTFIYILYVASFRIAAFNLNSVFTS